MKRTYRLAVGSMASAIALLAHPASAGAASRGDAVAAQAGQAVRANGGEPFDRDAASALYRQAALDGSLEALLTRLAASAEPDRPVQQRVDALLTNAWIAWQRGLIDSAIDLAERAVALQRSGEALLLRAQLLDARGDPEAVDAYEEAGGAADTAQARTTARLQASLLRDAPPPDDVAGAGLSEMLALIGRPEEAIRIEDEAKGHNAGVARSLQVAHWAMAANDPAQARVAAWQAYRNGSDVMDRRYALALLAESYREAKALPEFVEQLGQLPQNEALANARIDAFLELGRFDDAVALARRSGAEPQRLIAILELAQQKSALITEYRRLVAAHPQEPRWYEGLAAAYLADGRTADAIAVYEQLFARNRGSLDVQTDAARQMIAMGLVEPALEQIAPLSRNRDALVPVQLLLFDTYRSQGRMDEAENVLERLRADLAPGDRAQIEIADRFESAGRQDLALATLTRFEAAGGTLGYDDQLHIAELEAATGAPGAAVTRLQRLMSASTLPARRAYLNGRVAAFAKQAGTAEALAADLEAQLQAGRIDGEQLDLLMRLRDDMGGGAEARAAVDRFAAATSDDNIGRLKQLAVLYGRMNDDVGLDRTYRRLAAADPANATTYLRNLVQNIVRGRGAPQSPAERQQALDDLLARLEKTGTANGAGGNRAFRAAVNLQAGLVDQAIPEYRRAILAAPQDVELPQRLAVALAQAGRTQEAYAGLQFQAVAAPNRMQLIAAVDGLALLASRGDAAGFGTAQAGQQRRRTLEWALRLLLADVAVNGGDEQIYAAIADLADELADGALQRRALEEALAITPGEGRVAMLRQLIATSTSGPDGSTGPAIGDAARKLRFGNRLIALRKQLPPDVYTDLGRAMLAQGDLASADLAFSLIEDIPGLVNSDAERGDALIANGYRERALDRYAEAQLRNRYDLDLLLKTQILRETQGQAALANRAYWEALSRIIAQQPLVGEATQDLQWYGDILSEGLILTWQENGPQAEAIIGELDGAVSQAVSQAASQGAGPAGEAGWRDQLRLNLLTDLAARIVTRTGKPQVVAPLKETLAPRFGDDPAYQCDARNWTGRLSVTVPLDQAVTADLKAVATCTDNAALELALLIANDDRSAIAADVRQAIAQETSRRADPSYLEQPLFALSPLQSALLQTSASLSRDDFRQLVLEPLAAANVRDLALFDLVRASPALLARLEQAAGESLLDGDTLVRLLIDRGNDPAPRVARARNEDPIAKIMGRLSPQQQIALFEGLVERHRATGENSVLRVGALASLLDEPLDRAQQARVLSILQSDLTASPELGQQDQDLWPGLFLKPDIARDRRAFLLSVAQAVGARFESEAYIAQALAAEFAGDSKAAFDVLMARQEVAGRDPSSVIPGVVSDRYGEEWRSAAAAFLADPSPSQARIDAFWRRYLLADQYGTYGGTDAERKSYFDRLLALRPGNPGFVAGLLDILLTQADFDGMTLILRDYHERSPTDQEAATDLQILYMLADQKQAAAEIARASGADATDPDWMIEMINRAARASNESGPPDFRSLFSRLYSQLVEERPTLEVVTELARRGQADGSRAASQDAASPLARVAEADPARAPAIFHDVWRWSASSQPSADEGMSRVTLLDALPAVREETDREDVPSDPALIDALTRTPMMTAELDNVRRALPVVSLQAQRRLTDLIAAGLARQGQADARTNELLAGLNAGSLDRADLHLLATLLNREQWVLGTEEAAALRSAIAAFPNIGATLAAEMAELFGASGDYDAARVLLTDSLLRTLYPPVIYSAASLDRVAPALLVRSLARWPDRAMAGQAYQDLRTIWQVAASTTGVVLDSNALPPFENSAP